MAQSTYSIPTRFKIARRWQWQAALASALFLITCFVGWPLGYLWPSAVGLIGFLPAVWLFSIKCHECHWPAFADYHADERLSQDHRLWTRLLGKDYGGVHLPLRPTCTKRSVPFA